MRGSTILQQIRKNKIVAILRGVAPDAVPELAAACHAGGIRWLEISLNSTDAYAVIRHLNARMGEQLLIGAGTVLDATEAAAAIAAGAKFIISPALDIPTL